MLFGQTPPPTIHGDPGSTRPRIAAWSLPVHDAVRRARRLLRDQISHPALDAESISDLDVVITELTSNAVRHAPGPYELRILHIGGVPWRIEVADAGTGAELIESLMRRPLVVPDQVEALEVGGRGLLIVAKLTSGRCGARQARLCGTGQNGTVVWFDLPTMRYRGSASSADPAHW
ncbi:ATP-binding protein [Thermopolyspora sp. NPDC052614]|uniref:ATP-binding protein n=1 Tax=Thermopolyspora sp. NPDC052614 TaxID=3155682 RepID=UPI00342A0E21